MKDQETIKVKANHSERTFTIKKYVNGVLFAKYRTIEMTSEEFDSEEMNTERDWINFLRNTDDYYKFTKTKKLRTRQLKKFVKEKYPNAVNIELGSNGITNGIWFYKDENAKLRTFIAS